MVRGGAMVLVPRFEPGQVLATISRTRPVAFPGVPTMFQALLDHKDFGKTDWSSLRICISGGAPMPAWCVRGRVLKPTLSRSRCRSRSRSRTLTLTRCARGRVLKLRQAFEEATIAPLQAKLSAPMREAP